MNKLIGFLVFLVTFLVVLGIAIYLNRNLRAREPSSRPYRWGYFFAIYYCVIMSGAVLADRSIASGLTAGSIIVALVLWLVQLVFAFYPIVRRLRSGWVIGTILSLNPIIWLINYFYGKHRWSELKGGPPWAAFVRR